MSGLHRDYEPQGWDGKHGANKARKSLEVGAGLGELSVFCQSYFNKTLIDQAGSIGRKARQEAGVEQRDWEYSGKTGSSLRHSCADHRRDRM